MVTKIVLDTNIIISAFGWKGSPHKIFHLCNTGDFQLYLSPPLLSEISKVLTYKKFHFTHAEIDVFMSIILETASLVDPQFTVNYILDDPSDNRVLECALAAKCDYIITGDKHLLRIKNLDNIKIVSPVTFLKLV